MDYARRARLLVGINLAIFAFNLLVMLIFSLGLGESSLALASLAGVLGNAVVFLLLRFSGSVNLAGNLLLIDMWAMLHIMATYLTGAHDAPVAWVIFLPVLAITICNTASGVVWTIFALLEIGFFTWLASVGAGNLMWEGQDGRLALFALTHVGLLVLLATTAFLYENFKDRTLERLNSANLKLSAARDRALEANRAKSAFVANMSHELRTPLNAVIGYADMLAEDVEAISPDELRADLARIQSSGKHLLRLINELLEFSRMESGRVRLELEEFPLYLLARELVQTMENEAAKNLNRIAFEMDGDAAGDPSSIFFRSDPTKLRQCLYNLISNACKFTHEGSVTVRMKMLRAESPQGIDLVVFEVIDDGIGMTLEQLDRVFEPFVQAEESIGRRYGGTGLGLSLSRRLAETLGGTLDAYSEEGRGSRFVLTIPRIPAPTQD